MGAAEIVDVDRCRLLDELAARATVSPVDRTFDGWYAKAAPDLPFRRCNAVLPARGAGIGPRTAVVATVEAIEAWYSELGQRVIVQVSSADPGAADLDRFLAERGYEVEAPVHLMVRQLDGERTGAPAVGVDVQVVVGVDEVWADRYAVAHGGDSAARRRTESYGRMLRALGDQVLAASATLDDRAAGVGFGVLDSGWVGTFGMGTAAQLRSRGVGRAVAGALLSRAADLGATGAYLQVETDNPEAISLYRSLGFERSHGYHYRVSAPR